MKSNTWKIGTLMALGVLVLFSVTAAFGQTSTRFTIPFQFLAGEQAMPAGTYLVNMDQATRTLSLRHQSGLSVMSLRVIPGKRSYRPVDDGKLLFKAYGNARVLSRIWTRGYADASDLPVSNAERELARTERAGAAVVIAFSPAR